ncbi:nuclear transport factor 2 family protein [Embleya sp. NPDC127516]|uniref:nuclear transport factor 2 family protein n=1 Tax=Embleya sp. NPDC127516 TaxID=3363990 RepID=UPI003820663B
MTGRWKRSGPSNPWAGVLTARATGRVLDTWVMQMITIRNGLITEIRPFYWDTKAVDAALTP